MKKAMYDNKEGNKFEIELRTFEEFHGITLCFITLNEEENIKKFIEHHSNLVKDICMVDGGSVDKTVDIAIPIVNNIAIKKFDGHYGNAKNRAIEMARTDWILFLDPDERLSEELIKDIPGMIEQDIYDCYSFPRREFLSGKENPEPYPDYQDRLFRAYCRYVRPIHHELVGYKNKYIVPENSGIEILHKKELGRHSARNCGYGAFETHLKHEMGNPGCQTKSSFIKEYPDWGK